MMNPGSPPNKGKKRRAKKESAKQERKNLLTENPVVNRSDDNENIGRGGKGPKPMSRTKRAKASVMKLKDGLVSRFKGSTPKIGKNELMKPVLESIMPAISKIGPTMTNSEFKTKKSRVKPTAIKVGPKETPSRLISTKIRSYDFDGASMKQQSASPSPRIKADIPTPRPKKKT